MYLNHSHYKEEDFVRVLKEMKQLKCFHLYHCEYLDWSGTCLLQLPHEIFQDIFLMSNYNLTFDSNILPLMIKKWENLQAFGIEGGAGNMADGILEVLPLQANTLKNLKLQFEEIDKQTVLLSTMTALVHLEKLNFSCCFNVTDTFLEAVGKKCKKLKYLNLYSCLRIKDHGISCICDLENLTYLNIGGLPKIENPPLGKLTNLVYLHSCLNKNIEEECLCSVLEKAHQLRALDVNYCSFITNKLLSVAAEALQRLNSNIGLDLCVTGTLINIKTDYKKPLLLNFVENPESMPIGKYGIEYPFIEICDQEVSIY